MGNSCPQYRQYYQNLENPERLFYYKEFREGTEFKYDEDCLNLNIYTPKNALNCPVVVFSMEADLIPVRMQRIRSEDMNWQREGS